MIEVIQQHLLRYPQMQIRDAAKLIYQNEFGGGHMISNPEMSLQRIHEEYMSLDSSIQQQKIVTESIGNHMSRIYLSSLSNGLQEEVLNEMFVQSANNTKGTIEGLERKLRLFLSACSEGTLPFSPNEATSFIIDWREKGYPAISHSSIYRETYKPAYRVIEERYCHIFDTILKISDQLKSSDASLPYIIGIDGMSGSGKSFLGSLLHKNFPESSLFHMDDYFLRPHQRTEQRSIETGGNVDYERFKSEILDHLSDKKGLTYHKYDCCTQTVGAPIHAPWKPLVFIEGSYSQHPYFENIYNLKLFCEITPTEQLERILYRNGKEMLKRFKEEWIPKENAYFKTFQIREQADLLL